MKFGRPDYDEGDKLARLPADMPVFLLLAQDMDAPDAVEDYARRREARNAEERGDDFTDEVTTSARRQAASMRAWQFTNGSQRADIPNASEVEGEGKTAILHDPTGARVAELLGARLYEVLRDRLADLRIGVMQFTKEPLDAVRPAFVAAAEQLMRDAREERETWTRQYIADEARRMRDALETSEDWRGRFAVPHDLASIEEARDAVGTPKEWRGLFVLECDKCGYMTSGGDGRFHAGDACEREPRGSCAGHYRRRVEKKGGES